MQSEKIINEFCAQRGIEFRLSGVPQAKRIRTVKLVGAEFADRHALVSALSSAGFSAGLDVKADVFFSERTARHAPRPPALVIDGKPVRVAEIGKKTYDRIRRGMNSKEAAATPSQKVPFHRISGVSTDPFDLDPGNE